MRFAQATGEAACRANAVPGPARGRGPKPLQVALVAAVWDQLSRDNISKLAAAVGLPSETAKKAISASVPMLLACLSIVAARPEGARKLERVLERRYPLPIDAVTHAADHNGQRFLAAFGIGVVRELVGGQATDALRSAVANYSGAANHQAGLMLGIVSALLVAILREEQHRQFLSADQVSQLIVLQCDAIIEGSPDGPNVREARPPDRAGPFDDRERRFRKAELEIVETAATAASIAQGPAGSRGRGRVWAQYGAVGLVALALLTSFLFAGWGN